MNDKIYTLHPPRGHYVQSLAPGQGHDGPPRSTHLKEY